MIGRGQCHTCAKQPKTAMGRACAHRSGSRHDQKKSVVKQSRVGESRGGHRREACAHTSGELWWLWARERIALPISTAETTEQRRRSHFFPCFTTSWPPTMSADVSGSGMAHHLCAMLVTCPKARCVNSVTTNIGPLETYMRVVDQRQDEHSCLRKTKTCV